MTMRHVVPIITGLLLVLYGTPSVGEEIAIFGNEYKPPKYYLEENKPKGILVDIMRYIDQETENTFVIELYPWLRAYHMAKSGKGGIIGLSMTTERLKIFDYSDVIYYDELVLVVLKCHEFPIRDDRRFGRKDSGCPQSSSYGDEYERGKRDIFTVEEVR